MTTSNNQREPIKVSVVQEPEANDLPLPSYATEGAAGVDLLAHILAECPVVLRPGERKLISTGLKIALPTGFEAQVRPRSGLALKHGVTVLNSPGTIDEDYRGIIQVILINLGAADFTIRRGDRIAQMIVAPVSRATWESDESLSETERGEGGFGSTGTATSINRN